MTEKEVVKCMKKYGFKQIKDIKDGLLHFTKHVSQCKAEETEAMIEEKYTFVSNTFLDLSYRMDNIGGDTFKIEHKLRRETCWVVNDFNDFTSFNLTNLSVAIENNPAYIDWKLTNVDMPKLIKKHEIALMKAGD